MSDRIKPHSPDTEQRVLGCMLLKQESISEMVTSFPMGSELFYDDRHAIIYESLTKSSQNDPLSVYDEVKKRGVSIDLPYIAGLMNSASTGLAEEVLHFGEILREHWVRRKLIESAYYIEKDAYDSTCEELLERSEGRIMSIGQALQAGDDPQIKTVVQEVVNDVEEAFHSNGKVRGIKTGFDDLDWKTFGFKPGQLIIIAARPAVGKTSLAMNIVENVCVDDKIPVGVFSLEMTAKELIHRMACSKARIDSERAQSGRLLQSDFGNLTNALGRINQSPLKICERGALTVAQVSAKARQWVQRDQIKLLVVDYLQLMRSTSKGNRNDQITEISGGLKALAKNLKMPVIALSQLSRDVEKEDRQPRLSDLRDSGSIEQDADVVIMLHPDSKLDSDGSLPNMQPVKALIPKVRGGKVGAIQLMFNRPLTRFEGVSRMEEP